MSYGRQALSVPFGGQNKLHKTFAFLLDNEEAETSPARLLPQESGGKIGPSLFAH